MTVFGKSMYKQGVITGEARGQARGEAAGQARALSDAADWYQRKLDSEARGETFDEPPPWERNGYGRA